MKRKDMKTNHKKKKLKKSNVSSKWKTFLRKLLKLDIKADVSKDRHVYEESN